MNKEVKEFIEDNINLIENDEWQGFLLKLIKSAHPATIADTLEALYTAGVDFYSEYLSSLDTSDPEVFIRQISMLGSIYSANIATRITPDSESTYKDFLQLALRFGFDVYQWDREVAFNRYIVVPPTATIYDYIATLRDHLKDVVIRDSEFRKISRIK